jgi:hypothetical protein
MLLSNLTLNTLFNILRKNHEKFEVHAVADTLHRMHCEDQFFYILYFRILAPEITKS